jgi:hypothetical protein
MIYARVSVQQHVSPNGRTVAQARSTVILPSTETDSLHSDLDPTIEPEQTISTQVDAHHSSSCSYAAARSVARSFNSTL